MWQKIKIFSKKIAFLLCILLSLLVLFLFLGVTYCFVWHLINGNYKEAVYTGFAAMLMLNAFLGD